MRVYSSGKLLCCHNVKLVIQRSKCLTSIGYKYGSRVFSDYSHIYHRIRNKIGFGGVFYGKKLSKLRL